MYYVIPSPMPRRLLRNVPRDLIEALNRLASNRGRSGEVEHRDILEHALRTDLEAFRERAGRLRDETRGRIVGESAALIRADRRRR